MNGKSKEIVNLDHVPTYALAIPVNVSSLSGHLESCYLSCEVKTELG